MVPMHQEDFISSLQLAIALAHSLKFLSTVVSPVRMEKCQVNKALESKRFKKNMSDYCRLSED